MLSDADLTRAIRDEMEDGEPHHYLLVVFEGSGGDTNWIDLANWLWVHGVPLGRDAALTWAGARALRWLRGKLRYGLEDRQARMVAMLWKDMQEISSPYQLRYLIDRRSEWIVDDLGKKLRVNPAVCKALLKSLGYVPDAAGAWHLGTGKKAKLRRQKWIADEAKDELSATFELYPWTGPKE